MDKPFLKMKVSSTRQKNAQNSNKSNLVRNIYETEPGEISHIAQEIWIVVKGQQCDCVDATSCGNNSSNFAMKTMSFCLLTLLLLWILTLHAACSQNL